MLEALMHEDWCEDLIDICSIAFYQFNIQKPTVHLFGPLQKWVELRRRVEDSGYDEQGYTSDDASRRYRWKLEVRNQLIANHVEIASVSFTDAVAVEERYFDLHCHQILIIWILIEDPSQLQSPTMAWPRVSLSIHSFDYISFFILFSILSRPPFLILSV